MDCSLSGSSVRGILGKNTGVGCHFLLQGMDLPDPGIEPASPSWQADSLPLSHLGSEKFSRLSQYIQSDSPKLLDEDSQPKVHL